MRYHNPLDGLFFSQTATRVLRVLSRHPEKAYTGRELAAAAGAPHHRAGEALARLQREGVVSSRVVGNAYLWQLKSPNVLTKALRDLFHAEDALRTEFMLLVRKHLSREADIERVTLFGSAARKQEGPGSDIDLLVIVSRADARSRVDGALERLRQEAWEGYRARLRPLVYTSAERKRKGSLSLFKNIEREGMTLEIREGLP